MGALLGGALLAGTASAAYVTIEMVTPDGGKMVSLDDRQVIWKSPFGGWGIRALPFYTTAGDKRVFQYIPAERRLMNESMGGGATGGDLGALMNDALGDTAVKAEDLLAFKFDRPTSASVDLDAGEHTFGPFGIKFAVDDDGVLTSSDPRVVVDPKGRRMQVICHPVEVRLVAGPRSMESRQRWQADGMDLLGGIEDVFAEYKKLLSSEPDVPADHSCRSVMLYLPASAPGETYDVENVAFTIDAKGQVKLAEGAQARCENGNRIYVEARDVSRPSAARSSDALLSISWFGASGEVRMSCGQASVAANAASEGRRIKMKVEGESVEVVEGGVSVTASEGASCLPVPATGNAKVTLNALTVALPAATAEHPHRLLLWDVDGAKCWVVASAPLEARPGGPWSCRITAGTREAKIPATLKVQLDPVAGGADGSTLTLTGDANGVFSGALPSTPGFWRLRVADEGELKGQTLGLALIADKAVAGVSLFTVNNRALYRRGDTFDLLWLAKLNAKTAGAGQWPVRLRGLGLDTVVAQLAVPADRQAAGAESGRVVMDTRNLAPGEYTVAVVADGVAGYPFTFRVCQLEPLSDFAVYSFFPVVKMHTPYPGSPVNAYINHMPGGPGLAPYFADGDGSMDASLAGYAGSLFGPARESFDRPSVDELKFMALAAMGLHTAPLYPVNMAAEDQNPQHSLPENLQNMRRRMALYMQQHADFPGLDGVGFGWYASIRGFWEYTAKLDGWQDRRNAMYGGPAWELCQKEMAKFSTNSWPAAQVAQFAKWQGARAWSTTLPRSFHEWLADARQIRPGLTMHNHKPTNWLGSGEQYPPMTYDGMSHRSSLDYHDYCSPAGCEWRPGAFLGMGNQGKQKLMASVFTHTFRSELVPIVFGGAGRGLDGFNVAYDENQNWEETMFRIFERYGSWFRAHDPLPDVALYWTGEHSVASTVLYDLGRLRRPAMLVSPEDLYAGELAKYKVLLLVGVQSFESPEILATVKAFAAKGGTILKDDSCAADMPGQSIGFAYTGEKVATSWGLGGSGEWEHAAPWWKFTSANPEGKENALMAAFAKTPQLPVTTPDTDILISPLGGKDSIVCFTWNKREVPLAKKGRWRQSMVMPKLGELQVAKGWYVHNLLTGKPEAAKSTANGQSVPLDFTGFEGKIFLLTQREPKSMAIRVERPTQETARLTGWLADSAGKPLADPMPFEVTLKGPDGSTLFHKFAALGPDVALDVPVPGMAASETLDLVVRDLVLGTTATQTIAPAAPAVVVARPSQDFVGGEKAVLEFLSQRKGAVTILLDEAQQRFLPAAEKMAALLKKSGREARVQTWDLADILPMHLRWNPLPLDIEAANSLTNGVAWAWRVNHSPFAADKLPFSHPACGFIESGPALRHESDVVMFGTPDENRALAQVEPYLRRKVTGNYPAPGGFFVHHIWSPFLGGYNALYVGCRDVAGAEAAVEGLASLKLPAPAEPAPVADAKPLVANAGAPVPVENMAARLGGTEIMGLAFTPSGKRLFVANAGYAEWFFILDPATGNIVEKRLPPEAETFPNWWRYGRWLEPVNETSLRIGLWNGKYHYDLDKGFVSRMAGTPEHYLPGPRDGGGPKVKASTRLDDPDRDRIYLGGNDRIHAIDKVGNLKWTYYDALASPDLKYPRGVFPRAVSGDGKVLIAAGFGVHDMMFATSMQCPGLVGIDTATGQQLWTLDGVVLNGGKVVALMDRFIVMDDDGNSFEVMAATGKMATGLKGVGGIPQWVVTLQGGKTMLVVDNERYSRQGRTSRVFIRPLAGGKDVVLPVTDRVTSLTFAPDKLSFVIGTKSGEIVRFSLDGAPQWKIEEPTASGRVVFSPDGKNLVLGGGDGVVRGVDAADGKVLWRRDLNAFNDITDERFLAHAVMPEVPQDKAETPSAPPPEPSYLTSFQPGKVSFGPNLAQPAAVLAMLNPAKLDASSPAKPGYVGELTKPLVLKVNVEKGQTYLLELLNGLVDPAHLEKGARLDVAVTTDQRGWKNLPLATGFRIGTDLTRRRMAFRADGAGVVTLTLRATRSVTTGEGKAAKTSIEDAGVPVLLGDVVVSAMRFPGRSLLLDGGPGTDSQPAGLPDCTGYPHQDGSNTEKVPIKERTAALRMVNGILANPSPVWVGGVDYAEIIVKLDRPRKLSCIAIFEAGVPSTRYRIDVSGKNKAGQPASARIGTVFDNTQFVNVFPCPDFEVTQIHYVWAGRFDGMFKGLGNSAACIAQFEVYAAEAEIEVEEIMNIDEDDMEGGLGL